METIMTCPLGSECEEAKEGKIYRCRWYVMTGKFDAETNQIIPDSEYHECCLPMLSLHLTELKKGTRGVQKAVESGRNEATEAQEKLLSLLQFGTVVAQKKIDKAIEDQKRLL